MRAAHTLGRLAVVKPDAPDRPSLSTSVVARLRAPQLDGELAAGIAPWRSPAHAARSVQLTSLRERRSVAESLEHLVRDVARPPALSSVMPPCREQVLEAESTIIEVARRLRSPEAVDARGVARLLTLLRDSSGPCYVRHGRGALARTLHTANQWLDVDD